MNSLNRSLLPSPLDYFPAQGLEFKERRGSWRTTRCPFHGGSDSLRINVTSGGWVCMACGEKGGDILAFHMAHYGLDFASAAKELGVWMPSYSKGGKSPAPFTAKDALGVIRFEALLCAVAACNVARGIVLVEQDRERLVKAAATIEFVAREVL